MTPLEIFWKMAAEGKGYRDCLSAYEYANKRPDTSCLMVPDVAYCEECAKKRKAMASYATQDSALKGENILHQGGIIEHWCNSPDCAACNKPTQNTVRETLISTPEGFAIEHSCKEPHCVACTKTPG